MFYPDERAMERCYWRRVGFGVFALLAVAMIALLAGCATVESKSAYDGPPLSISDREGNSIRLTKEPCPNVSGWLAMSVAQMVYEGKKYLACWVLVGTTVVVFDSNGDATPIPAMAFKQDSAL